VKDAAVQARVDGSDSLATAPGDLLLEILARLDRIEAALGRLVPEPRLSRADRLALMRLLPVLRAAAAFEAAPFTVRDVFDSVATRAACSGRSKISLGKLFARSTGTFINGLRIERYGQERHVVLWRVAGMGVLGEKDGFNAA
jgi:hypothetical protein